MSGTILSKAKTFAKQRLAKAKLNSSGASKIIKTVRARNMTYLADVKLVQIVQSIAEIERDGRAGAFLEAGCALGGSAAVIADRMSSKRQLFVHDVFGMIPPPSENDPQTVHDRYQIIVDGKAKGLGNADEYYGYVHDLKTVVRENLGACLSPEKNAQVELVEGLVEDTLIGDAPIAFAHIDVDWYDPVKLCLERIDQRMSEGGIIIIDDYFDWESCKRATDEFLAARPGLYDLDASLGNLKLTKRAKF